MAEEGSAPELGGSSEAKGSFFSIAPITQIEKELSAADTPITIRMQRLFELREHRSPEATSLLLAALKDRTLIDSILFRHEAAYVLGQLADAKALAFLEQTLEDETEHEMVRHEAAEALAAVGDQRSLSTLCKYLDDASGPVRDTCILAKLSLLHKYEMEERERNGGEQLRSPFNTIDPSEAFPDCTAKDIPRLSKMLLDEKADLWNRYRALMTLRDLQHPAALAAVAASLRGDASSALFRHEVAFVLGQARLLDGAADACLCTEREAGEDAEMKKLFSEQTASVGRSLLAESKCCCKAAAAKGACRKSYEALAECLEDEGEHIMARHEAALALGSLASDTKAETLKLSTGDTLRTRAVHLLKQYCNCPEQCVAESCQVALHQMAEEIEAVA